MAEKPAENAYPLHDLLRRRWSPRAFASRPIEPKTLGSLLEAMRWAASSRNEQPWRLLVVQQSNPGPFERLVSCLAPSNQTWAKHAPVLMLVCAKTHFEADATENAHAFYDCGAAVASLTLQALSMELWVHQMAGFSSEAARGAFKIPSGYSPVVVLAVGYYGDAATLEAFRQKQEAAPRARKTVGEIAFFDAWGSD